MPAVRRDDRRRSGNPGASRRGARALGAGPDQVDSGVAADPALRPLPDTRNLLLLDGDEHLRTASSYCRRSMASACAHTTRASRDAARRELAAWPSGHAGCPTLPRMQAITLRIDVCAAVSGSRRGHGRRRAARSSGAWSRGRPTRVARWCSPSSVHDRLIELGAFQRRIAEVDGALVEGIARRRAATDLTDRTDILSLLLRAHNEGGAALTDRELRDELLTLLVAGVETTAAALSWTLTEVARVAPRRRRGWPTESRAGRGGGRRDAAPASAGTAGQPARRARRPLTIAGWQLPAGATLASCSLLIHRRPDIYQAPTTWRVDRSWTRRRPPGRRVAAVRRRRPALRRRRVRPVRNANRPRRNYRRALVLRPARSRPRRVGRRGIVIVPSRAAPLIATARATTPRNEPASAMTRAAATALPR